MACRHLQIEITSRCNLRCTTCLYGHYPERWVTADLKSAHYRQIIDNRGDLESVHLQGWGESLLRADVPDLVRRAREAGLRVSLSSNGTIMTPQLAGDLIAAGLDSMAFSFAGVSAAQQDPLRGPGTFDRARKAAKLFGDRCSKGHHPPLLMNFILLRGNHRHLNRALHLARRLGMARLQVGHLVHPVAPAQKALLAYPDVKPPALRLFGLCLSTLWHRVELVLPSLRPQPTAICPKNPLEHAFVGADGAVSPCVYLAPPVNTTVPRLVAGRVVESPRVVMGHLGDDDLETIWQRNAYRRFRRYFARRVKAYEAHLQGITPDLEGLHRLENAVDRLDAIFRDELPPPPVCRGCPHLDGF